MRRLYLSDSGSTASVLTVDRNSLEAVLGLKGVNLTIVLVSVDSEMKDHIRVNTISSSRARSGDTIIVIWPLLDGHRWGPAAIAVFPAPVGACMIISRPSS